jgi:hypothetical protein
LGKISVILSESEFFGKILFRVDEFLNVVESKKLLDLKAMIFFVVNRLISHFGRLSIIDEAQIKQLV